MAPSLHLRRIAWRLAVSVLSSCMGCGPAGYDRGLSIQDSASNANGLTPVNLNLGSAGVYVPILPRCLVLQPGNTVEFRNFTPTQNVRVLGLSGPRLLRSPNLRAPYNYVSKQDPFGSGAPCLPGDASCVETVAHTFWRATLTQPGTYDWVDGAAPQHVQRLLLADGSAAFIPSDGSLPLGTVCVTNAAGDGCAGVCCGQASDCAAPAVCVPTPATPSGPPGRCLVPAQ